MKAKPNPKKSEKDKSKQKPNNKQQRIKDLNISNSYLANYDSKKNSHILQQSNKRSKNQKKFNSIKKQSENIPHSLVKFGSSDSKLDSSSKALLLKKKYKTSKLNQIKNPQEKYGKSKIAKKTNSSFSKTDHLKFLKNDIKHRAHTKERRISASINTISLNLEKIKLNLNKGQDNQEITCSLNEQRVKDQFKINSDKSKKYQRNSINQTSNHMKEIKSELKYLKKSRLKKSLKVYSLIPKAISRNFQ